MGEAKIAICHPSLVHSSSSVQRSMTVKFPTQFSHPSLVHHSISVERSKTVQFPKQISSQSVFFGDQVLRPLTEEENLLVKPRQPLVTHLLSTIRNPFSVVSSLFFGGLSIRIPDQDWVRDLMGKADSGAGQ